MDHTNTNTTTPSGHGVHICHRCGWPFPNSHPSSKHRRAHKRICGTIEGYTKKLVDSEAVSDDEIHSDEDKEKTPRPMIEKGMIKESGSTGRIEEKSNRSEDDLFADAVTEFSDSGISPVTTKLLDSPIDVKKVDDKLEVFGTPDTHTKDADKTEENDVNTVSNLDTTQIELSDSDTKPSGPLVEDKDGSHKDKFIDLVEPYCNTVKTIPDSAKVTDVTSNKDQGEEAVYVLSVSSDIPLVDHAETLVQDFKDHKPLYSNVPLIPSPVGNKDAENRSLVDGTFEIKTVEEKIEESQTSKNDEPSVEPTVSEHTNTDMSGFGPTVSVEEAKVTGTQPLETSKTVTGSADDLSEAEVSPEIAAAERASDEIKQEKLESDHEHVPELVKEAELDHGVPVLTEEDLALGKGLEAYKQETVKEPESGIEAEQKIVESVGADLKDSGNVVISQVSERLVLEKTEQSHDASGVVSETLVDESDGKLMTSQDCGVDVSVGSSSRNSLEGNWGSVSVLSTASYDVENAHYIGKSEIAADKNHLGKSDAFEGQSLVEVKEETVDQKASEIKAVTVQNYQPPKSEANVSNETGGRKRNEEAIAKVTNWSTGEHTNTPLKNLITEAKSSNPKQLSTMIQKEEAAEKISEPAKSNLAFETPPVNQESSPPKYIDEGKKVRKKAKGRASWMPFVCCSSVNVN